MSYFKKLKKIAKNNFSWDSWQKGKGIIGHYNPFMKIYRDTKKVRNGFQRGSYGRALGKAFNIDTSPNTSVNSAASFSPRSLSQMYGG